MRAGAIRTSLAQDTAATLAARMGNEGVIR